MFEPVEENAVIDGIKCSAKILESEKRHLTIITDGEKVIQDSKCRSFSAGSDEHRKLTEVEAKVCLRSDGQVTETSQPSPTTTDLKQVRVFFRSSGSSEGLFKRGLMIAHLSAVRNG